MKTFHAALTVNENIIWRRHDVQIRSELLHIIAAIQATGLEPYGTVQAKLNAARNQITVHCKLRPWPHEAKYYKRHFDTYVDWHSLANQLSSRWHTEGNIRASVTITRHWHTDDKK
ncbi:hypothetical protein I6E29_00880 [Arcanobacterium haemolyticum]|nr:hypothetical protein [Arcanobacterium haemolyticum]